MNGIDLDLGALTIPVFVAIFSAGWTACLAIKVKPLTERITVLEEKEKTVDEAKDEELKMLRLKVYG